MIIGLDVGGTHTDCVLLSEAGIVNQVKVPTMPEDLFETVLSGFTRLLDGKKTAQVHRIVISTTLTTNALVLKVPVPTGMIVVPGPGIDPEYFRTDEHFYVVEGSINHRGVEKAPVNKKQIKEIAGKLKEAGIEYVGVVGKFSVRNPAHELEIQSLLQKGLFSKKKFQRIFLGHHVSGNLNFPRRIATTSLNAAVFSLHKSFFEAVQQSLAQMGFTAPIQVLKADGGTMNLEASMNFPAQTVLSGPAASIMGSIPHAPKGKTAIVLDIGGTTTDISFLVDQAPLLEPMGIQRGKYKSLIRSLRTDSKGIGGDSACRVKDGQLKIGPKRKGPSLAAGGPLPTPTDAMNVLGVLSLGDTQKSLEGITRLGEELGLTAHQAADEIFRQSCNIMMKKTFEMVDQINSQPVYTVHEFLEGYSLSPDLVMILGGPAVQFAEKIEELYHIPAVAVPNASVANAIGAACARTTCEVSLHADTEQGMMAAYEEDFSRSISSSFTEEEFRATAFDLLQKKALKSGAEPENLEEMEMVEFAKFNIVRNFSPKGRLFRCKAQVKPGLIKGYETFLQENSPC